MKQLVKNKVLNEVVEWIICFVIAYVIYIGINFFFGTIAGIRQTSMYPTAKDGERVIVGRRVLYNKDINRGDIVTLAAPDEEVKKDDSIYAPYLERTGFDWFVYDILEIGKKSYVKRVIAVGGDSIKITESGEVYLNEELLEENYLAEDVITPITGDYYDLVVPEGYVFVMGDNRGASKDSREFGVVPLDKIEGKVHIRIWPLNRWGEI